MKTLLLVFGTWPEAIKKCLLDEDWTRVQNLFEMMISAVDAEGKKRRRIH